MPFKDTLTAYAKGDSLHTFWRLFRLQQNARNPFVHKLLLFLCYRCAHRHGGYIGADAVIKSRPSLPHGLHGVFISRYAEIGANCRIYQNVTNGEVHKKAPVIGDDVLIGAGAVLIGGIRIGNRVKIGAGAVVRVSVPDGCTVTAPPMQITECDKK